MADQETNKDEESKDESQESEETSVEGSGTQEGGSDARPERSQSQQGNRSPAQSQGQERAAKGSGAGNEGSGSGAGAGSNSEAAARTYDEEYVRKLREESAKQRKRAQDVEGRLKTLEDEKLSEEERKAKRIQDLESQVTTLSTRAWQSEVAVVAVQLGAIHPEAVARLADSGNEDVQAAVETVKKSFPALFKREETDAERKERERRERQSHQAANGAADANSGQRQIPKKDMNEWIRTAAGSTPRRGE